MFVDKERISLKSGDGGNGATSFLRYKGVANGGPDGGDGGRGGHIYFIGDRHKTTLIDFHFKHKYVAESGGKGEPNKRHGKDGEDLYIPVPLGTVVKDAETDRIICDIYYDGQTHLVLEGGNGGKGNVHFCTSRRHAPHFSQTGEKTELRRVILELKTIADVGLIGFPNVGKSTILSKVSGAKPKIANYHFTTMSPNLGVVGYYDESFICADIPGLIEGASEGAGLGFEFLRHIERTRILVHVVDISGVEGRDPYEDYKQIITNIYVVSPASGNLVKVQIALNEVFDFHLYNALTCDEFNELGFTIDELNELPVKHIKRGYTVRERLHDAKRLLMDILPAEKVVKWVHPHSIVRNTLTGALDWLEKNVDINTYMWAISGCFSADEIATLAFTCDEINDFNINCNDYVLRANEIMVRTI